MTEVDLSFCLYLYLYHVLIRGGVPDVEICDQSTRPYKVRRMYKVEIPPYLKSSYDDRYSAALHAYISFRICPHQRE
jgi:hypothetical protein